MSRVRESLAPPSGVCLRLNRPHFTSRVFSLSLPLLYSFHCDTGEFQTLFFALCSTFSVFPLKNLEIQSLIVIKTLQVISSLNLPPELSVFDSLPMTGVSPYLRTPNSLCSELKNRTVESRGLEFQIYLGHLLLNISKWKLQYISMSWNGFKDCLLFLVFSLVHIRCLVKVRFIPTSHYVSFQIPCLLSQQHQTHICYLWPPPPTTPSFCSTTESLLQNTTYTLVSFLLGF